MAETSIVETSNLLAFLEFLSRPPPFAPLELDRMSVPMLVIWSEMQLIARGYEPGYEPSSMDIGSKRRKL
jgi:hypothetical protein